MHDSRFGYYTSPRPGCKSSGAQKGMRPPIGGPVPFTLPAVRPQKSFPRLI